MSTEGVLRPSTSSIAIYWLHCLYDNERCRTTRQRNCLPINVDVCAAQPDADAAVEIGNRYFALTVWHSMRKSADSQLYATISVTATRLGSCQITCEHGEHG